MFRGFSLLLMWIALVCSGGALAKSSTPHLNGRFLISSNVDTVQTGLTKSMIITCSIPPPSGSGYIQLVSLVISKNNTVTNKLEEIVSINSFAPSVINNLQPTTATTSALLNNTGTSFLQLNWTNPQESQTGFYQCESTVLDGFGHPITLKSGLDIKHADPTLTALVDRFRLHEKQQEDRFRVLELQLDDLKDRISMATGSMFDSINATNGWTYHFSKFAFGDVDKAEAACNLVNGHLVDFENKAEYDLVIGYIKSGVYKSPSEFWLIGLSDEATEGTWLIRHNGQPAGYIQWGSWGSSQPDNGTSEDCSTVNKIAGGIHDFVCTTTSDVPFICKSHQ